MLLFRNANIKKKRELCIWGKFKYMNELNIKPCLKSVQKALY